MRFVGLLVMGILSGCGGAAVDPAMGGDWTGSTTANITGLGAYTYASQLTVAVTGARATITKACPLGDGSIPAIGHDREATWSGEYSCAPVQFGGCDAVAMTFRDGVVNLLQGGVLIATGSGEATGCGTTRKVSLSFQGRPREVRY